jgi:hypothetical protein
LPRQTSLSGHSFMSVDCLERRRYVPGSRTGAVPAAVTKITAHPTLYCFVVTAPSSPAVQLPSLGGRYWRPPFLLTGTA